MADRWRIESYETVEGSRPFETWAEGLAPRDRRALVAAIDELLVPLGPGICATPWGRHLGQGLFELRIGRLAASAGRPSPAEPAQSHRMLLRVFCHACGDRVVVLLGGYDKLRQPKKRERSVRSGSPGDDSLTCRDDGRVTGDDLTGHGKNHILARREVWA